MRVALFSSKPYTRRTFNAANEGTNIDLAFLEPPLNAQTAVLADGFDAVCAFVNDRLDAETIEILSKYGIRLIALRSAGFNHVDLTAAAEHSIAVVRVPAYSPYAVAEHTLAIILALNRHIVRAYNRVREGNFELEGLLGFDLHGRTVGVIGTGAIGFRVARMLAALGCRVLAHDIYQNPDLIAEGVCYVDLPDLYGASDVVTLHCPLNDETRHLINRDSIARMKRGVMLINTSRGQLINTNDVISALKTGQIGYLGIDVYEEEELLFFSDHSGEVIQDDVFSRLLTFPNVLITGHQAFFTEDALINIAETTLANIREFDESGTCRNSLQIDIP